MKRSFIFALIVFVCFSQVWADNGTGKTSIEIDLPSRTLSLYMDGMLYKEYPVGVGKPSSRTPQGQYRVIYKAVNPYWLNKGVVVPPGPQNPLGVRWIGITKSIGIHGNNMPSSIGNYVSAGCIRMYNRDVEELYELVTVNTPVIIKYDRIRVFEDRYSGEKAAVIYPDSYKKGAGSDKLQLEKLSSAGIPEELMNKVREVSKKAISRPQAVSYGIGVFLNEFLVTCDALEEQGEIFVNYKAAEDVFGLTAEAAEAFDIEKKELEGKVYVNLSQAVRSFGGSIHYDETIRNVYISMKIIKVNGVFAGINNGDMDRKDYLAVDAVKRFGYEYSEDLVDLRIFGKGIIKVNRNDILCVNVDNITEVVGGSKYVNSRAGIVDLALPVFLRLDKEYFRTENINGRLVLSPETAYSIFEKTGWAAEAFSARVEKADDYIDLEAFLENFEHESNYFGTVIYISMKESQGIQQ